MGSPALFTRASRRALGSAPISEAARVTQVPTAISSSVTSTQLSFLGRRFLRCVATLLLELIVTSSPAHPLRRAYAPTTCSSSSILDWLGLGIKESSLHRVLRHRLRHPLSSRDLSIGSGFVSVCTLRRAFKPSCFRRWCRTSSVLAALPSRGGGQASGHRGRFHRRRL